ncbi:MAG: hydroxymethylglutaryl-CoA lyase [Pseudomonadota bacterium]
MPDFVNIVEVGPRDGLQNEKTPVSVATRVRLINALADAGLKTIEAGAFVSPKWVPQMADTDKVLAAIDRRDGVSYPVLTPNMKGYAAARAAGVDTVAVFGAASETFSQKNTNASIEESFERFAPILDAAKDGGVSVRGYVSCVLGCPYEGDVSLDAVRRVSARLYAMGCYEVSLGDTIGVGTPENASALLKAVRSDVPIDAVACHFHDTNGRAIENLEVCLEAGVRTIDASVGGLGGCPYADGATGNVATEKVVRMLDANDYGHGVDLAALGKIAIDIAQRIRSGDGG